jgi:hypothetical protein
LFIQDNNKEFQTLTMETKGKENSYKWTVPTPFWGKYYTVTVQAINKNQKVSLLSDPAVVKVLAKGEKTAS